MDVTLSLNEEARTFYEEDRLKPGYFGSLALSRAFVGRGHNLSIVHPDHIYTSGNDVYARNVFSFHPSRGFTRKDTNARLSGDVFFVYGLGEDKNNPVVSKSFLDLLYPLEDQFTYMLNSAESSSYEFKPKQKKLDLPWIPTFAINSTSDLSDLLFTGEKIIAKPSIGYAGRGVLYLESLADLGKIPEREISSYVYEKFVPSQEERRYIFLDNQLIIRRRTGKQGKPGKEYASSVDLMEGVAHEIEIARRAINEVGMFYGTVDFREQYLLEINGSGAGVIPPSVQGQNDPYNLSGIVVQAVERLLGVVVDSDLVQPVLI